MYFSKVTQKGQIIIPPQVRKKYKIKAGTRIYFYEELDCIKIIPIVSNMPKENFGIFDSKGRLLEILSQEKDYECEL